MRTATRSYLANLAARASLAFVLALIGFSMLALIGQSFANAAATHVAHSSSASMSASTATLLTALDKHSDLENDDRPPNPTIVNGQWYCQPPYIALTRQLNRTRNGIVTFNVDCVLNNLSFPCSDTQGPNESVIQQDWLSGDTPGIGGSNASPYAGHFAYTYPQDTYALPQIATLFGYMQALGFIIVVPSIILMGYNFLLGAVTLRYANSLEGLSRAVLGAAAVGVCFTLVQMMINFETTATVAISMLHAEIPFPRTAVNGAQTSPYMLSTESAKAFARSYRGLVVPMSRWGCAVNDFMGIFADQFISNKIATIWPVAGDFAHLAGNVTTMSDLIHRTTEMTLTALSILLWAQVFIRIVVINYYILMAPLSFSCWALPGGAGQKIVTLWFKGFISILFVQVLQVFILTTLPLILPTLPPIPADNIGIMQSFLAEFPPILTLCITLMAPSMIGVTAGKVLGTAGSMAGQTAVVLGTAVSRGV
jgi:hypothetical protein